MHNRSTNNKTAQSNDTKITKSATGDNASNWLHYTAPNNDYEINLADGWELSRTKDGMLFTEDMSKLVLKPGTKAVVKDTTGNSPSTGFVIEVVSNPFNPMGDKEGMFKTNDGEIGNKYIYHQTETVPGSGILKGGKAVEYYTGKGTKTFAIIARFQPGDTDTQDVIEKVINTLKINF